MIDEEGKLTAAKLGLDLEKGEVPQVLVPKGMIFGSAMEEATESGNKFLHPPVRI
jgi:predicted cupin superfamily sugar epimerase